MKLRPANAGVDTWAGSDASEAKPMGTCAFLVKGILFVFLGKYSAGLQVTPDSERPHDRGESSEKQNNHAR
jgi:hypothetical protein